MIMYARMWECKHCGWLREDEPREMWSTCPNCDNHNWMRQGERNDISWTQAAPVQEGWYWAWDGKYQRILKVEMSIRGYVVRNYHPDVLERLDWIISDLSFTHWLGPLPAPEPPMESE